MELHQLRDTSSIDAEPFAAKFSRYEAAGIHFGVSLMVACLSATIVFLLWYPSMYRTLSDGSELFSILIIVDVILGPCITLLVANPQKARSVLKRDLVLVVALQLLAFGYGLFTVIAARPVHLVFEYDRLRVVHAADVDPMMLAQATIKQDLTPLTGPTLLGLRPFKDNNEQTTATLAAISGASLASRADLWQPYEITVPAVLQAAQPVKELINRFPNRQVELRAAVRDAGLNEETALYLPLVGRKVFWTAILNPNNAQIVASLALDPY